MHDTQSVRGVEMMAGSASTSIVQSQSDRLEGGGPFTGSTRRSLRLARSWSSLLITVLLTVIGIIALYPLYFTLITSFKTQGEYARNGFGLPSRLNLDNFRQAFDRLALGQLFFNSFVLTLGGIVLCTVVCLFAAYAVTKLRFPGRNIIFLVIVGTLLIPFQTIMYPLYHAMLTLQLADTYQGLILVYGAFGLPLGTYLLAAYFKSIPHEIIEAAVADGANHFQILLLVLVPMSVPAISALAILNSVWMWNELLLPLVIMSSSNHMTVMIGIASLQGQYDMSVPLISAGLVVATVPIIVIYLVAQTQLIKGLTAGAVK